ncbi:hypothetical protein [Citreimonas sp.]|uniref:hypothetical protein n=1 Tax=Citreimonas sp. TaxID=3036715 RepID=UPI004059084A
MLELQSWSFEETSATIDYDSMGSTWMKRKGDIKDASGDIVYLLDDTASGNAQASLTNGAEVTLELYSMGDGASAKYRTGPAIITGISEPVEKGGIVTVTASWVANGAWSTATVAA